MAKGGKLMAAAALCALIFVVACARADAKIALGKKAPDFKLKRDGGGTVTLKEFTGKSVVVAAFWSPAFAPSLEELEKLRALLKKGRFASVRVIAITRGKDDREKDAAREAFKKHKLAFPILWDDKLDASKKFQINGTGFFIIDKKGNLASGRMPEVSAPIRDLTFEDVLGKVMNGGKVDVLQFVERMTAPPHSAMLNKPLVDFKLKDLGGQEQAPVFYKGFKKLVIVFFSPTCPHCLKELPLLQAFYRKNGGALNFEVLAVTSGADKAVQETKRIRDDLKLTFPVVLDPTGRTMSMYEVTRVPLFFVADEDGTIREIFSGEIPFLEDTLTAVLKKMKK